MEHLRLFRRILVGVDEGGLAANAILRGVQLADRFNAQLDLLHAVDIPPSLWPGLSDEERARMHGSAMARARKAALEVLAEALPGQVDFERIETALHVIPGHPPRAILKRAEAKAADLILLGPHAKTSWFDFGSTSRALFAEATTPIWTQVESPAPIKKILLPVDFSKHGARAIAFAARLAAELDASVELLHCYVPPTLAYGPSFAGTTYVVEEERDHARRRLDTLMEGTDWGPVDVRTELVEGDPIPLIGRRAGADLIVMGTHGRTGLSRFVLGSVAYGVLKSAATPVLVVPSTEQTWLLPEASEVEDAGVEKAPVE